ncbi:MAG: nuclear transport factor 2 family protein [Kofleriaceae bacterium]
MTFAPIAVVESWQSALNARDLEQLSALTARDVELIGPRGTGHGQGHETMREWFTRAGFTAQSLRWFCDASGVVVVEQRGRWWLPDSSRASERIIASAFRVVSGRVVRYQRFEDLSDALGAMAMSLDDEVLVRS